MFNLMKTAVLMAAITALFMLLGRMLGGQTGMGYAAAHALLAITCWAHAAAPAR